MSTYPIDSDEYRDRREAQDDRMSPLDLAVEAATEYERKAWLQLHDQYNDLKREFEEVGQYNIRLRTALYEVDKILRNDLFKSRVFNALNVIETLELPAEEPIT